MPFGRKIHCSEADLSAYLDGRLAARDQGRCVAHLAACGECRGALDGLSTVRSSLQALPRATAPRSFRLRQAQVEVIHSRQPAFTVRAMPLLSGVSVVSLVAFLALVGINASGGINMETPSSTSSYDRNLAAPVEEDAAAGTGEMLASTVPPDDGALSEAISPTADEPASQGTEPPPSSGPLVTEFPEDATQPFATPTQEYITALDPGATPAATAIQESAAPSDVAVPSAATRPAATPASAPGAPPEVDVLPDTTTTTSDAFASQGTPESPMPNSSIRQRDGADDATRTAAELAPAATRELGDNDGDSNTALYVAMAATAALALGSGSLAFAAYRRTR